MIKFRIKTAKKIILSSTLLCFFVISSNAQSIGDDEGFWQNVQFGHVFHNKKDPPLRFMCTNLRSFCIKLRWTCDFRNSEQTLSSFKMVKNMIRDLNAGEQIGCQPLHKITTQDESILYDSKRANSSNKQIQILT